jgi:HSP20 family protein
MFELSPFDRKHCDINTYNPFHELEEMRRSFFGDFPLAEFRTDIKDNGDSYLIEADLPGFKKEDINIDIDSNYLHIYAERHSEREEKDKKGNYITCERSYGSFSRRFNISSVKADEITAEYTDGVLRLTMPKKESTAVGSRRLEIQ